MEKRKISQKTPFCDALRHGERRLVGDVVAVGRFFRKGSGNDKKLPVKRKSFTGSFQRGASETEILIPKAGSGQLGGAGRHPFQRVVPESAAVGTGGHHALFRTDDLSRVQLTPPGAVGAAGLDGGLKQFYGGSLLCRIWVYAYIILHSGGLFHCFFVPRRR